MSMKEVRLFLCLAAIGTTYRPKEMKGQKCAGMIIEENESEFWAVGYNTDIRLCRKK